MLVGYILVRRMNLILVGYVRVLQIIRLSDGQRLICPCNNSSAVTSFQIIFRLKRYLYNYILLYCIQLIIYLMNNFFFFVLDFYLMFMFLYLVGS